MGGVSLEQKGGKLTVYAGFRHSCGIGHQLVAKDDDILSPMPSQKLHYYSPDFNWGYGGAGPSQLALALLLDVTGDPAVSLPHHQQFKWQFVSNWGNTWSITSNEIRAWLQREAKVHA